MIFVNTILTFKHGVTGIRRALVYICENKHSNTEQALLPDGIQQQFFFTYNKICKFFLFNSKDLIIFFKTVVSRYGSNFSRVFDVGCLEVTVECPM